MFCDLEGVSLPEKSLNCPIERKTVRNMSRNEAEKRFWKPPELAEGLLPFLDPSSILTLAQAHPLTTGVIQGTYNWGRFIRRSCPYATPNLQLSLEEKIEQKVGELKPIIGVLELIGNPQAHLLQLLDAICERFPSEDARKQCVKMTCPIHEVHSVSALCSSSWLRPQIALYSKRLFLSSLALSKEP